MRVIKIILAVTGLLLVAAILWSSYLILYLNENKGLLEERFSASLGREVRIEKRVSARWSLTPSITLEGLWIGNPDWAKGDYLVRAERALVQIDLLTLLQQRLDVKEITVEGADVLLETAEDGKTNWSFGDGEDGIEVRLDAVTVKDSQLSHRSPDGEVRRANMPEMRVEGVGSEELELKARFTYRDVPVSASLKSRPQAISRAGERPFQGEVEMPGTTLKVVGELKGPFELASLEVALQSDRLDLQKSVLGLWIPTAVTGSLQNVDGRFRTTGDSPEALIGNLGGELKIGSAAMSLPAEKGAKAEALVLNGLNLAVAPKAPVRLKAGIVYAQQPFQIDVQGGLLADLFDETKSWKTLKLKATGQSEGKPFEITGDVGPLSAIHARKNLGVKLRAKHDELVVQVDGTVASLGALSGSRLKLNASGPSLSRLKPWLDLALPDTLPFKFSGQLIGGKDRLDLKGLKLISGNSDVSGDLSLPAKGAGSIEARLQSDTLDLQRMLRPAEQAKSNAPSDFKSGLEYELPTDAFKGLDGSLKLKVRRMRLYAVELERVDLDIRVDRGKLDVVAKAEEGRMNVDVSLAPAGAEWQVELRHTANVELGDLIDRSAHADDRSKSPLRVDADLQGTGKSLTGVLDSTQGRFTMVLGGGVLSETVSGRMPLGGVLYSVLSVIDPLSEKQKQARLECAVIHLEVSKGLATTPHGLAMRTKEMNLLGGGTLTLDTGAIDIEFKTAPRKGLGLSVAGVADRFIRLTGTLWEPTVGVNAKSALKHGTAAWLTGGLSLLFDSAFRRLTSSSNPCEAVQKAIKK